MADWTDLLPGLTGGLGLAEYNQQSQNNVLNRQAVQQNIATSQYQLQAAQTADAQKQAKEAQYQAWAADYVKNPTPQKLITGTALFPEKYQALKAGWAVKDDAAAKSDLGFYSSVAGALRNKRPELAIAAVEQRLAAEKDAGIDTSQEQTWLDSLKTGDPEAMKALEAEAYGQIAAATGPDKFADTFGAVTKDANGRVLRPGDQVIGADNKLLYTAPFQPQYRTVGPNQNLVEIPGGGGPASGAPGGGGSPVVPFTAEGLAPLFSAQESSGSYTARNPDTGAMGRWQIMPGTGAKLAKKLGLEWRPDMMLHDQPADREYQDKIGAAARAEAVAVSGGDPAKAFSYYYSGNPNAYKNAKGNPKTAKYVTDMMTRYYGGDPRGQSAPAAGGARVIASGPKTDGAGADYVPGTDVGGMSSEAIDAAAQRYNMTGKLPVGLGRKGDVQRAVLSRAAQFAGGTDTGALIGNQAGRGADVKALDKLSSTSANVLAFERTAVANGQIALDAATRVGNGGVPVFNRWVNAGRRSLTGDADVSAFDAAVSTFANEFAKVTTSATGGGVTSDSARQHVYDLINTAQTLEQFRRVMSVLRADMANRRKGIEAEREAILGRIRGPASGGGAPGSSNANPIPIRTAQEAAKYKGRWVRTPDGRVGRVR